MTVRERLGLPVFGGGLNYGEPHETSDGTTIITVTGTGGLLGPRPLGIFVVRGETVKWEPADGGTAAATNGAVRGIRNTPCVDVPGKRAPTPELCHDPNGYQPEGDNPPFGPPNKVDNNGQPLDKLLGNQNAPFIAHVDPGTGTFVGPDGHVYRRGDVNADGSTKVPSSWQQLLQEPTP
ncbi:hypothetical protein [Nocardia sp. NPDC046763]|uniref:hypothetical protein n=1 Tax=Nocardia sp. NPDC046763 TaxID=3155256 RepID=UPI0033C95AEF